MSTRYPIVYIRGYAMTVSERNETAADPFCGFNVGSTLYRATNALDRRAAKFVFESPIVRLASEYQYQHAYQDGYDIMDPDWRPRRDDKGNEIPGLPPASIVIYRYYDDGSDALGDGKSRNITVYAAGLNDLLKRVKELVLQHQPADGSEPMKEEDFGYHLVAHSMGGLVARAFLQSANPDFVPMRKGIKRFFTFATPHNGIDVLGINVPSWLTAEQAYTFNRDQMTTYLNLGAISPRFNNRVDLIPQSAISADNIFCMVGTNRGDYEVAQGVVRAFVGNGSDGLVRIDNASLWGVDDTGDAPPTQVATAYAFRSHSGYYGIVNSEEAYQNLVRFLFGDVRVDIWVDVESVTLPAELEKDADKVTALYQFEMCASPRGKRWFLTRRKSVEDSPAIRTHQQLTGDDQGAKTVYMSSVFLSKRSRVDVSSQTLSYAMIFAVKVPDYEIEKRFWPDGHFEGTDLFSGTAIVRVSPPPDTDPLGPWRADFGWNDGDTQNQAIDLLNNKTASVSIPFDSGGKPGIKGALRLVVRPW
ncbi:triacylglycerol lipase [Caballeronia sp. BR00000012568055]|uniref:esterase/lipase family protein n=1 Tax=Caballeronia sp. BR00000012568055 TaxID=2918761 RepID=UPI0023F8D9D8|nr:hypothetical protein [Caballeronia sp. BR00000012568055]